MFEYENIIKYLFFTTARLSRRGRGPLLDRHKPEPSGQPIREVTLMNQKKSGRSQPIPDQGEQQML